MSLQLMITIVWVLLGLMGAIAFIAVVTQPDQELQTLAVGLVIAALVYVGFAIIGDANRWWIITEMAGVGVYGLFAALGLRYSTWWLMLGWIAHPVWDIGLHFAGKGAAFTPVWYAIACMSFDLLIAAYILGTQVGIIHRISLDINKP